jgi:hypothetical protein
MQRFRADRKGRDKRSKSKLGSMLIMSLTKDNTCLNKGHADIVAYKGVFIYFLRRRLFKKNSSCQANQSVPHTTVTFYGGWVKNVRRLRPELWRQSNWLLHHDNPLSHTFFFNREFSAKNSMTVFPQPPYFYLFPRLKIELKSYHFDTIKVIAP